jgi:AcrR family transcriptional regulator
MIHSDPAATRDQLVALACAIIEERGVQALSMQDLAARAGVSPVHLHRHFADRNALLEAIADYWFQPLVAIMDDVVNSDLPARRKLFEFFARRFARMRAKWESDPDVLAIYVEVGQLHYEQVGSYVDLADHYLGVIIGQAMSEGHFAGLEVDETISLINQMVAPYCSLATTVIMMERLSEAKLARIIDALCDGLTGQDRGALGVTGLRAA